MTKEKTKAKNQYHHGDLKRVLVLSATKMVSESGTGQLSLREVARRAGVTHTAPYRHFRDKSELLALVAATGFEQMNQQMSEAGARHTGRPAAQLKAKGEAYVAFSVANPNLFKLMFGPELADKASHQELMEISASTYALLLEAVQACQQEGNIPKGVANEYANACWSMVHGLALLLIDDQITSSASQSEALIRRTMEILWVGLAES